MDAYSKMVAEIIEDIFKQEIGNDIEVIIDTSPIYI